MSVKYSIADRLRQARGRTSQASVASRLGIHTNTIGKYERGERSPDAIFLAAFCKEFCVSAEWLLLGSGPMYPNECTGTPPNSTEQIDLAERLVLDLIEESQIDIEKSRFNAIVDVLRADIITKTKALIAISAVSSHKHSMISTFSRDKIKYIIGRILYVLEWTDEEKHAWLLSNYGIHDYHESKIDIDEKIAGHLFDILVEKFGRNKAISLLPNFSYNIFPYEEDENGVPLTIEDHLARNRQALRSET